MLWLASVLGLVAVGGVVLVDTSSEEDEPDAPSDPETDGGGHEGGFIEPSGGTVTGTEHGDVLAGSGSSESIFGGAGDDQIGGYGGNDWIDGGADSDVLHGQDGDDSLFGGDGSDLLHGENGADWLEGGAEGRQSLRAFW